MKTRTTSRWARSFALAGAVGLAGCGSAQKAAAPEGDIEVRVDRMMPQNESLSSSAVAVKLGLFNPKSKAVKIDRVEYELDTGKLAGVIRGESKSGGTLEAAQKAELEFRESIPFPDEEAPYRALLERGTIPVGLKGLVHFADGSRVGFERQGAVATPLLPKFVVHDAQAAQMGKERIEVSFFLRLINENVFPITVDGVAYTVTLEDREIRAEQGAIGVRLVQGAVQEFEVSVILEDKKDKKDKKAKRGPDDWDLKGLVAAGRLRYRVQGAVSLSRLEVPFDYSGEIKLSEPSE